MTILLTRKEFLIADSLHTTTTLVTMDEGNSQLNTNNEILIQVEQMIEKNEGLWKCKL